MLHYKQAVGSYDRPVSPDSSYTSSTSPHMWLADGASLADVVHWQDVEADCIDNLIISSMGI